MFCDEKTIITIYVDDLLITNFNKQFNKNIKTIFSKQFHMIDFDFITHYFDIKLDRNKFQRILWFNQRVYLKKNFKNHDFFDNKSIVIFMKISTKLKVAFIEYIVNFDFKHIYQFVVEFFMYVMLDIRFDIVYFVFVINRYVFNFDEIHWTTIKRIFRYLKNTLHFRFIFFDSLKFLIDWTNVDWINNKNIRRFIFDYVFNFDNTIIIWFFKRQFTIALSICEIEYMNQIQVVKKIIWFFELFNELNTFNMFINIEIFFIIYEISKLVYCLIVIVIYCDNQKTQALVKNFINHFRMKHMNIQHHFVREKIIEKQIQLKHVFTTKQIIDDFIKLLFRNSFEKFRKTLNFIWIIARSKLL